MCKNSDFFPQDLSCLMEVHIRNPCCARATTANIYLMQMRCNLLCTQVCFIIQNLSWNPDEEKKKRRVMCEISSEITKLNSKENTECHSICRPIKPNTFEYIWKHGVHLAHVTNDEHLLEAILSVRANSLKLYLNIQHLLAQPGQSASQRMPDCGACKNK